jgi:hypothetical protein
MLSHYLTIVQFNQTLHQYTAIAKFPNTTLFPLYKAILDAIQY